jgi:hypothetical protein
LSVYAATNLLPNYVVFAADEERVLWFGDTHVSQLNSLQDVVDELPKRAKWIYDGLLFEECKK